MRIKRKKVKALHVQIVDMGRNQECRRRGGEGQNGKGLHRSLSRGMRDSLLGVSRRQRDNEVSYGIILELCCDGVSQKPVLKGFSVGMVGCALNIMTPLSLVSSL